MTDNGLRIRLDGADLAAGALERGVRAVADMTPVMDVIGGDEVTAVQMRFETGRDPDGAPWPPSGRARLGGGKTLIETRRLFDSITHAPGPAGVEIGTNDVKARTHQFGARIEAKNAAALTFRAPDGSFVTVKAVEIPARPFIGFGADSARNAAERIEEYMLAAMEAGR